MSHAASPRLTWPKIELPPAAPGDARIGHLLGRDAAQARVVIVGFPSDEGVRRNGGRPGAAAAPTHIRHFLYRLTPDARVPGAFTDLLAGTVDLGDLRTSSDLERDQQQLGAVLAPYLAAGTFVIVLGGGHETAYGHFLGYVQAARTVSIVNFDAHADVRPLLPGGRGHSGSPFRQALEHASGRCRGYHVAGLLPQSVAHAHRDFVAQRKGKLVFRDAVTAATPRRLFARVAAPILATFDIDAVDQAYAPGVSAPATGGLPADLWLTAAFAAGRSQRVSSVDVVETNPAFDRDGQTARLAALTVWHVLRGLATR